MLKILANVMVGFTHHGVNFIYPAIMRSVHSKQKRDLLAVNLNYLLYFRGGINDHSAVAAF